MPKPRTIKEAQNVLHEVAEDLTLARDEAGFPRKRIDDAGLLNLHEGIAAAARRHGMTSAQEQEYASAVHASIRRVCNLIDESQASLQAARKEIEVAMHVAAVLPHRAPHVGSDMVLY